MKAKKLLQPADRTRKVLLLTMVVVLSSILSQCQKDADENVNPPVDEDQYTITQAISDEAQRNTISFDGLAFLTGNLG